MLLSSHLLAEITQRVNDVVILAAGHLVAKASLDHHGYVER